MFSIKDLRLAAHSQDGESSVWFFRTDDSAADLQAPDYFNGAVTFLNVGDRIAVFASRSGKGEHLDLAVTFRSRNKVRVGLLASVR